MNILIDYWAIILALIVMLAFIVIAIINFMQKPSAIQIANIKEWLRFAVTEAERDLGSGTGQLKLRKVYDMALSKYPLLIRFVRFEQFSEWVDDALKWMREQLTTNPNVESYVQTE